MEDVVYGLPAIVLAGLALGTLVAVLILRTDLPAILLISLSALGGASAIVTGFMLVTGSLDTSVVRSDAAKTRVADGLGVARGLHRAGAARSGGPAAPRRPGAHVDA